MPSVRGRHWPGRQGSSALHDSGDGVWRPEGIDASPRRKATSLCSAVGRTASIIQLWLEGNTFGRLASCATSGCRSRPRCLWTAGRRESAVQETGAAPLCCWPLLCLGKRPALRSGIVGHGLEDQRQCPRPSEQTHLPAIKHQICSF